ESDAGEQATLAPQRTPAEVPPATDAARRRPATEPREEPEIPVVAPHGIVLVEARLRREREDQPIDAAQRTRLEGLVNQIHARNPYQVDRNGQLYLPGFAPIALSGLTEQQATQRLSLEPALRELDIRLTRLPLSQTG